MQDAVVYVLTSPLEALSNSSPLTLVMVVAIIFFGALFSLVAVVLMSRPFPAPKRGMGIKGKAEGGKRMNIHIRKKTWTESRNSRNSRNSRREMRWIQ